jgi:hypothetical protein
MGGRRLDHGGMWRLWTLWTTEAGRATDVNSLLSRAICEPTSDDGRFAIHDATRS